ncbi:hypothetical protein NYZ21_20860, partial [Acinetobacter baumannii]|nr:hypothetical protein [Acinetobacter baumannii]
EVRGLSEAAGRAIAAARAGRPFRDLDDLRLRAGLDEKACRVLAEADALRGLILATLARFDGDKRRAAQALGLSLKTMNNRVDDYRDG